MHDAEQGKPKRRNCIDETGKVYGRLTVVEYAPGHEGSGAMWRVRCRCGRERLARGFLLRAGLIKSCGCLLPRGDRRRETTPLHTDPVLELMRERDELRARLIDAVQERNAARADWESCALNLAEVTRERDRSLACWEAAGMQGKSAHAAMLELAAMRDRLREQVVTVNNNIETFQKETWRYRHERDEALAEIAEWKRVTGYDDTETLDFECGRAGIRTHIDVCSRLRETANRERDEARAEAERLREECRLRKAERDQVERNGFAATKGLVDESERLRAKALAYDLAYRRGAEAMREACAQWVADYCSLGRAAAVRALPIPEEP
jgi:hypothetical protein